MEGRPRFASSDFYVRMNLYEFYMLTVLFELVVTMILLVDS